MRFSPEDPDSPLLVRFLTELGYACWITSGIPLPVVRHGDGVARPSLTGNHPEEISCTPATRMERRLWRQLRRTQAARDWSRSLPYRF